MHFNVFESQKPSKDSNTWLNNLLIDLSNSWCNLKTILKPKNDFCKSSGLYSTVV